MDEREIQVRSHEDLRVYKESISLVTTLYKLTKKFPEDERFGLTSQIRRAAVSIPTNIAEGAARNGNKEFNRFLYISLGSASELETLVELGNNLDYLEEVEEIKKQLYRIKRMLIKLIESLSR